LTLIERGERDVTALESTSQTIVSAEAEVTEQDVSPTITEFSHETELNPDPDIVSSASALLIKVLTLPTVAPFEIWISVTSAVRQFAKVNSIESADPAEAVAQDASANVHPTGAGAVAEPLTIVSASMEPIDAVIATTSSEVGDSTTTLPGM
jgi:hypothetical protein